MSNFAFQGFGLGEFFKAREKLGPLLVVYFHPPFLAPLSFLSLAETLHKLSDAIERLFDENGNPNSAILRGDNKLAAQMMLRVTSYGLMETVEELENLLKITAVAGDMSKQRWSNFRTALSLSGLELRLEETSERFAFLEWKLSCMFFQCLRRSKVTEIAPYLQQIQVALNDLLIDHQWLFSSPPDSDGDSAWATTASSASLRSGYPLSVITDTTSIADRSKYASTILSDARSEFSVATVTGRGYPNALNLNVIIQKFQDACEWMVLNKLSSQGNEPPQGRFVWRLKPETTLLILLHWVFKAKHALLDPTSLKQLPVQGYLNLLKSAFIIQVSGPIFMDYKENNVPDEAVALVGLLSCEVTSLFQILHERDVELPPFEQILLDGDFSIVLDMLPVQQLKAAPVAALNPSFSPALTRAQIDEGRQGTPTPMYFPSTVPSHVAYGLNDQGNASSVATISIGGYNSNPQVPIPTRRPLPLQVNSSPLRAGSQLVASSSYPSYPPPQSRGGSSSGSSSTASIRDASTPTTASTSSRSTNDKGGTSTAPSSLTSLFPRGRKKRHDSTGSIISITPSIAPALGDSRLGVYVTPSLPPAEGIVQRPRGGSTSAASAISSGPGITKNIEVVNKIANYSWGDKLPKPEREDGRGLAGGLNLVSRKTSGEIEIMPKELGSMIIQASYTGDIYGRRWDDCRVRIYKEYHYTTNVAASSYEPTSPLSSIPVPPTPETGFTVIRILTIKKGVDECVDQRFMLLEETELVPEYGFHDNFPVIYLRRIALRDTQKDRDKDKEEGGERRTKRSGSVASYHVNLPPAVASIAPTVFEEQSLFYKFGSPHDMFTFQHAILGESVESDVRSVRCVRYKRSIRHNEHAHSPARVQLWKETTDTPYSPTLSPQTGRGNATLLGIVGRANPDVEGRLKVHTSRIVMYLENCTLLIFVTDSLECELRGGGRGGDNEKEKEKGRDRDKDRDKGASGGRILRIKPSSYKSSLRAMVKARILGPSAALLLSSSSAGTVASSLNSFNNSPSYLHPNHLGEQSIGGIRLDKLGLTMEEEENGGGGEEAYGVHMEEFRWFEIEFGSPEEAEFFLSDFNRALMDRRRERKRREELVRMAERGVKMGSIATGDIGLR